MDPGTFMREAGSDIRAGDEVFSPGTHLGAAHVGVLSSIGVEQLLAHPSPTVGVLSTGDELITSAGTLAPGKIRDANRPALLAQLQADGFSTVDLGVAGDEEAALAALLEEAGSRCDAIVSSGGVSVGDRDMMKAVLKDLSGPTMRSMQVAIKPAKPFASGSSRRPGLRSSAWPGTQSRLSCLTSCSSGPRFAPWPDAPCSIDRAWPRSPRWTSPPSGWQVALGEGNGPHRNGRGAGGAIAGGRTPHVRVMAQSNALALLPDGEGVRAGERRGDPPPRC